MAKITINVERFRGTYELDPEITLSGLEWHWIKKIAGYMPLTIDEGFQGDDPALYVALAIIVLARDGKIQRNQALTAAEILMEAPVDGASIVIDFSDEDKVELADEKQADLPEA